MKKSIFLVSLALLLMSAPVAASPEPKCKRTCLTDGYYSITCDSICQADETLGHPFNVARRQYQCMDQCKREARNTIMGCIFECRMQVRRDILAEKEDHMQHSIANVEAFISKEQEMLEQIIESKVTSKKRKNPQTEPLIIE